MTILIVRRPMRAVEAAHNGGDGSAFRWVERCRRTIARWMARSRQRQALRDIADVNDFHLLKDIGVSGKRPSARLTSPSGDNE